MVDISSLDYGAHRHRLIEASLRRQYDDFQPPGDVVLNSLHLNSADSVIGVRLNDRYDHSLFDFVEEYYDVAGSRKSVERPHPLEHFLAKGARRPRTSEKETETIPDNGVDRENGRNHLPENVDGNPPKSPGVDDNGNPCVRVPADDVSATSENRAPNSAVPILRRSIPTRSRKRADKTTCERDAEDDCPRSGDPGAKTESSRNGTDRSRESKKEPEDHPPSPAVPPLSGNRRGVANKSNFVSVSSGEIASIRRDERLSCRSRESSISPSRTSSRPPWMSGNGGTSFNRKYCGGNVAEIVGARVARPQKLAVSSRSRESSAASTGRNPSFASSREKKLLIERQRKENPAARRRSRSKDVGSVTEEGRTLRKTTDSPSGEEMSASGTTMPTSFLSSARTPPRPTRKRSPQAALYAADAAASETSATKAAKLITNRSGGSPVPGNNARPVRDRRENPPVILNRGGRRRLRSAENPSKGASLSPQIELSAEVLNPADDTDKSAIPEGERLTSQIDPRDENTGTDDVGRSRMPTIIRSLPRSRGLPAAPRDANSATESGLNGAKLNGGSNGAVGEMRYDGSLAFPREAEELQLPRRDSKIGLAMNSALRRYIKMLKQGLLNHGDKDGVALASLSLSDAVAILSERGIPSLSSEEIQELQDVLDRIERNPELLRKLSRPSMESVA